MPRPNVFSTIRTEGGLLPADLLAQVAAASLPGMDAEADYHLVAHERLTEAISRSWNRLLAAWSAFRSARSQLSSSDTTASDTREKWLLPLFAELGYGRLVASKAIELDGRSFPVSHEWGTVPIHLVGAGVELDRRTPGVAGAARMSPHGLVQELLNASPERLWGFVSNGLQLRLLRDSVTITRQAYVEFDLEDMMDGEVYSDFAVLWLVSHQSRVEGEPSANCWLEKWSQLAIQQGTRALDRLRDGVEAAIAALGRGFLVEPANRELRQRLENGDLDRQDYYRQLLRLVYRLIFLMVAEDRDLLHPPGTSSEMRRFYAEHYSVAHLRHMAERRRGSPHGDLYEALRLVMESLDKDTGLPALGLPALGSFLWRKEAIRDLIACRLRNRELLEAVAALAFTTEGRVRRAVDYRNLGSEELGSVYESLLELHPELNLAAGTFTLATAGGHERKLTGSYYTPTNLINNLLDTALTPVLDAAALSAEPERAILSLKVVDPACGSGHFLIAAAHRIARRLALIRNHDDEPSPGQIRHALRDVIGRCVFGVDANPMSVELCKVSLWIETLDPGQPLSFLDQHIQLGNSLIGVTSDMLARAIPDEAFRPIDGDDRAVATSLRKRNRAERDGQQNLEFGELLLPGQSPLAARLRALDGLPDDSINALREKERRYEALFDSPEMQQALMAADAWCAAFMTIKISNNPPITEGIRHQLATGGNVSSANRSHIGRLADEYQFFHWPLSFAEVFAEKGGFDLVLGNPPWERVKLEEREFFAVRQPSIAASTGAKRKQLIAALHDQDPPLWKEFRAASHHADAVSHFVTHSGRYPLCGHGDINTYSIFAETMRQIVNETGRVGVIVPSGIATDSTTQLFFRDLVESHNIASLYEFANKGFFAAVGDLPGNRFCLLTMTGSRYKVENGRCLFFGEELAELLDENRVVELSSSDIALVNPNTLTCPVFHSKADAKLTHRIYERVPILIRESQPPVNSWSISFLQMFHMTNDSALFARGSELERRGATLTGNRFEMNGATYLPLYEAKMIDIYDHRHGDYRMVKERTGKEIRQLPAPTPDMMQDPNYAPLPKYWVADSDVRAKVAGRWDHQWLIGLRSITDARASERTLIPAIMPFCACGNQISLVLVGLQPRLAVCLFAALASVVVDYVLRQKIGGVNLNQFIVKQLPIIDPEIFDGPCPWSRSETLAEWIGARVLQLTYVSRDLRAFALDLGYAQAPFSFDSNHRLQIQCELDAAFFCLYGLSSEDIEYITETFDVLRRREEREFGEFRSKRLVLEAFDAIASRTASIG